SQFGDEPDTDGSLAAKRAWIEEVVARWRERAPEEIQSAGSRVGEGRDPSRHGRVVYRYALAGAADVDRALTIARTAQPAWGALSINERGARLEACAAELGRRRGDLIGAMI